MRLRLARHVPHFPWSADGRWHARPASVAVLVAGLWLFGTGDALLIEARLGNSPWSVLAAGVARHTPLTIGTATIAISAVVLLAWIPLRERPGLGTVANAVVIGVAVDVMSPHLPSPDSVALQLVQVAAGLAVVSVGAALYLSTQLGPGPRDGWMTGIARRLDVPIARVRLSIEASVLVLGWLLGGRVGVATLAFALLIGHSLAAVLGALHRAMPAPATATA